MAAQTRCLILFLEEDQIWGGIMAGGENEQFQFLQEISRRKKLIPCGCVCAYWGGKGKANQHMVIKFEDVTIRGTQMEKQIK